MDIEDALRTIKNSPECFITLRADNGEILSVRNLPAPASAEDRMACLFGGVGTAPAGTPTVSRFFESASVTTTSVQTLVEETQRGHKSMNARIKILNEWRRQELSELVGILESGDFPDPMTPHDSYILKELIFDIRERELTPELIRRLWAIADAQQAERTDEPPTSTLLLYLWRYEMKTTEFVRYWHEHLRGGAVPFLIGPSTFAGDLKVTDQTIINDLIGLVRAQWPFGVKQRAMIALGKIRPPAGSEAARAIREEVFDSTEWIIAQRDRVLARIETDPEKWHECDQCRRGKVVDASSDILFLRDCPQCYGLALIPAC